MAEVAKGRDHRKPCRVVLRGAFAVLRVEEDKWREKLSNIDENKVDLGGQAQLHRGPFGEKYRGLTLLFSPNSC